MLTIWSLRFPPREILSAPPTAFKTLGRESVATKIVFTGPSCAQNVDSQRGLIPAEIAEAKMHLNCDVHE